MFAIGRIFEPLLTINAVFALIGERPFLGAAPIETVIGPQTGLRVNHVEHDVDVGVLLVLMRDENSLMLLPFHVLEEALGGFDHMLAGRPFLPRPIQADMLDWRLGAAAAGADAGFLFQKLGIPSRPEHFIYGARHILAC
jgi:hypothetical protein